MILEGSYVDDDIHDIAQEFIQVMKKKTDLDAIAAEVTVLEWKNKMKVWKESTSTSPSGYHLGHSKCLIANHGLKDDSKEAEILDGIREKLIQWQVDLINLVIQNKYTYERWKTVVNVMILKDPGDICIHCLRVIHLYKQDYTIIMAIK